MNLVADVIDPRTRWRAIAGTWRSPATLWLKLYRTGHYTLGSSQPASRPFAGRGIDGDADDGRRVVMKGFEQRHKCLGFDAGGQVSQVQRCNVESVFSILACEFGLGCVCLWS